MKVPENSMSYPTEPYIPKMCEPEWFHEVDTSTLEDSEHVKKYQADHLYFSENFESAALKYKELLQEMSPRCQSFIREVSDSLIRCYVHMKQFQDVSVVINKLVTICKTEDHQLNIQLLQLLISESQSKTGDQITILHQLLTLHPSMSEYWVKLGHCYKSAGVAEKAVACYLYASIDLNGLLNPWKSKGRIKTDRLDRKEELWQCARDCLDDMHLEKDFVSSVEEKIFQHGSKFSFLREKEVKEGTDETEFTDLGSSKSKSEHSKKSSRGFSVSDTTGLLIIRPSSEFCDEWFRWIESNM